MRNASPHPGSLVFNGVAVNEYRRLAGLTQEGLARRMNVTIKSVQNWESGTEPTGPRVLRLAKVLKVTPADLFTREEQAA